MVDRTVYVSGVVGLNKDTMKIVDGGAAAEARQALHSLGHILKAAGSSYEKVVKSTIFLDDITDFPAVNDVYKECKNMMFPTSRFTFNRFRENQYGPICIFYCCSFYKGFSGSFDDRSAQACDWSKSGNRSDCIDWRCKKYNTIKISVIEKNVKIT